MNMHSSRSHAVFMVTVETVTAGPGGGKPRIRVGTLNMVDLAGSERQVRARGVAASPAPPPPREPASHKQLCL